MAGPPCLAGDTLPSSLPPPTARGLSTKGRVGDALLHPRAAAGGSELFCCCWGLLVPFSVTPSKPQPGSEILGLLVTSVPKCRSTERWHHTRGMQEMPAGDRSSTLPPSPLTSPALGVPTAPQPPGAGSKSLQLQLWSVRGGARDCAVPLCLPRGGHGELGSRAGSEGLCPWCCLLHTPSFWRSNKLCM